MSIAEPTSLPYEIDAKYSIIDVLQRRHQIPYHSRPFMWTAKEYIEVVLKEMIESWEANEQHWLGFIIIYNSESLPAISDAQHRLTVCFLTILALARILHIEKPITWISKYGYEDDLETSVPIEDQKVLDEFGWKRYPNIESCYEFDFEALGNILNDIAPPTDSESKIYAAYDSVYLYLNTYLKDSTAQRNLLRFIYRDIKVTRMIITEWRFTLRAFNSLNNIKVPVPPSILLKNAFVNAVGKEYSAEVHRVFREWEIVRKKNYDHYLYIIAQLYVRRLMNYNEFTRCVKEIPEMGRKNISSNPFTEFCAVAEQFCIMETSLNTLQFRKLLNMAMRGYEVMSFCVYPLAYMANQTGEHAAIERLLRCLVAFSIRNPTPLSFNPLICLSVLLGSEKTGAGVITPVLSGEKTVTEGVNSIIEHLRKWLNDEGDAPVMERLATEKYTRTAFKRARLMLLYLAELTDSHESTLNYNIIHIDHIYPKSPGKSCLPLEDSEYKHRLGNLTPFIGKNSSSELKGNSSLGNKSFDKKVSEYKKSNIAMTREVAELYENTGFTCLQIDERSRQLAAKITTLTAEELGLDK